MGKAGQAVSGWTQRFRTMSEKCSMIVCRFRSHTCDNTRYCLSTKSSVLHLPQFQTAALHLVEGNRHRQQRQPLRSNRVETKGEHDIVSRCAVQTQRTGHDVKLCDHVSTDTPQRGILLKPVPRIGSAKPPESYDFEPCRSCANSSGSF
jgi:hypothetical protein